MANHDQVYAEPPVQQRCEGCGTMMAAQLYENGEKFHPMCDAAYLESERRNRALKDKLISIITYVSDHSERSMQVEIGPSGMGYACDARIGRTLAGLPTVNFRPDPWASIVGTAVHNWLEKAVLAYQEEVADADVDQWQTEEPLQVDEMIPAHTDLWDGRDVIDYKTINGDMIAKIQEKRPAIEHRTQGHLYGKARQRAGYQVRDVVLVYLPRNGMLKNMHIWREPYDEAIADAAIARTYAIGAKLIELNVLDNPSNWAQVPIDTKNCWWCPFWVDRPAEQGPDASGCPGGSKSHSEREEAAVAKFNKGLI